MTITQETKSNSATKLEQRVRASGSLEERLEGCRKRIGQMCAEGRCPSMTIPMQWDDDDFFITTTLEDALKALAERQLSTEQEKGGEHKWEWCDYRAIFRCTRCGSTDHGEWGKSPKPCPGPAKPTTPQAEPELMSLEEIETLSVDVSGKLGIWLGMGKALELCEAARAAHSLREECNRLKSEWAGTRAALKNADDSIIAKRMEIERLTKELEQRHTLPTELDIPALKKWALTEAENGGAVLKLIEELEGLRGEQGRELNAANGALENAHKVNDRYRVKTTRLREALERLLKTAKLLQENAIDCSVNHYGNDHELHGLPGWLEDNQKDIDAASKALQGEGT